MSALLVLWLLVLQRLIRNQPYSFVPLVRQWLIICPPILEAQYSGVPLIVLSADRPHTLLHVGAPQTVDQQKVFGAAVNYYEELAVPQEGHYYTYPRQVARKAYMKAMDTKKRTSTYQCASL